MLRLYLTDDVDIDVDIVDAHERLTQIIKDKWKSSILDNRRASPEVIKIKYSGVENNCLDSVILPGHLKHIWKGFVLTMESDRLGPQPTDRDSIIRMVEHRGNQLIQYVKTAFLEHKSILENDGYFSNRVKQGYNLINSIDFAEKAYSGKYSIRKSMEAIRNGMCHKLRHNQYQVANTVFWKMLSDVNVFFKMNTSNLSFLSEIFLSYVFWMMGEKNSTWVFYFQAIQVKCGCGHYRITVNGKKQVDNRKPNNTGFDWSFSLFGLFFKKVFETVKHVPLHNNNQIPAACHKFTPGSLEHITTVTVQNGQMITRPPKETMFLPMYCPESRESEYNAMINVIPRNSDASVGVRLNTLEGKKGCDRAALTRMTVQFLMNLAYSTNAGAINDQQVEQLKTLSAVMQVMVPGSGKLEATQNAQKFNVVTKNKNANKAEVPLDFEKYANVYGYSIMVNCIYFSLMNKNAVVPWEMCKVNMAFLDWLFVYVTHFFSSMYDIEASQGHSRLRIGYEARQVAKTNMTQGIASIATSRNLEEACVVHNLTMHFNALSLFEVVGSAHSFLCRSISHSSIITTVLMVKYLKVPVINLSYLLKFFNNKSDSDAGQSEDLEVHNRIAVWVTKMIRDNNFCVGEDGRLTEYVSTRANAENGPAKDDSFMRASMTKTSKGLLDEIAKNIKNVHGHELYTTCHMGPEHCLYENAMEDLLHNFNPDFRQLLGDVLCARRALSRMRLDSHFPSAVDNTEHTAAKYAQLFRYNNNMTSEAKAGAFGINMWYLLIMASIAGDMLHPHAVVNVSRNLLTHILQYSPAAATPGNEVHVRSFSFQDTSVETIHVSSRGRPSHFPRPVYDDDFVATGMLSMAKAIDQFLPEDCLHCGFLFEMKERLLAPDIFHITGEIVVNHYDIMPAVHYAVYHCKTMKTGYIFYSLEDCKVHFYDYDSKTMQKWDCHSWCKTLSKNGWIVLPMIFRTGMFSVFSFHIIFSHMHIYPRCSGQCEAR